MVKNISGSIIKDGKELHLHNVPQAIDSGIAYVTEDRKTAGLVLIQDIKQNTTMANLHAISSAGVIDMDREVEIGNEYKEKLNTKMFKCIPKGWQLIRW